MRYKAARSGCEASWSRSISGTVASRGTLKVFSMRPPSWMRWSIRYSKNTTTKATASATGMVSSSINMLFGNTRDGVKLDSPTSATLLRRLRFKSRITRARSR
ncbi:hypothetical protein D9M71_647530 [compost metagenome]